MKEKLSRGGWFKLTRLWLDIGRESFWLWVTLHLKQPQDFAASLKRADTLYCLAGKYRASVLSILRSSAAGR